ncbi:hypothetical protein J6A31_04470 [bacterium]|nr:hypothetical protein [bacterium]
MNETLSFSIEGKFITNTAREKFYEEHNLNSAIELLRGALTTDQLNAEEITMLALKILNGDAEIVGRYPGDDYGLNIINETSDFSKVIAMADQSYTDLEKMRDQYNELLQRYLFICDSLSDYQLSDMNSEYYGSFGEPLFPDIEIPAWKKVKVYRNTSAVDSYIKARMSSRDDDYGWLSPTGEFYPGEWGTHEAWAIDYLDENKPFADNAELYWLTNDDGTKTHICGGDVLIHKLGWCLIDNPYQGEGNPRYDKTKGLTKAQKEFLYDYFIERNRHDDANSLYDD